MRNINEIAADIHETSTSKGFDPPDIMNMDQKLLLAISEICEAQNELRDGLDLQDVYYDMGDGIKNRFHGGYSLEVFPLHVKPEGFAVEIADAIIRLLHIGHAINVDMNAIIELKIAYNKTRPEKHGRQF